MGLPNKKSQAETIQSNELNNGTPNYAGISDLFGSNKGGYGFEPPSIKSVGTDLMNTKFGKGAQLGMKTYKPMDMPELIQSEDVVDPEMMALNRMRRY